MKKRSFLPILLLLTTLAGLGLAYREYLALAAIRYRLDNPSTGLEKEYADAMKLVRQLRDELAAARRSAQMRHAVATGAGDQATADNGNGRQQRRDAMRALFNSPQFQQLRAIQEKAALDQRYAGLFKSLVQSGETPQQIDALKNLLVQRQQAMMDAMQAAQQNGINPRTDPGDFRQAISDATSDVDNQIQSTLGASAYAQYQQYQQTLPEQSTVTQLQQTLSYSGAPLSDTQAQQLIQVLQQNQPQSQTGGGFRQMFGGGFGGGGGAGAVITQQAVTQAANILSPAQLQALQQIQQVQQAQQQMNQLMRANFRGGGGGGG